MLPLHILHVFDHSLKQLLPRKFEDIPCLFYKSHRNIFVALLEAGEGFLGESVERYSDLVSIFNVRLMLLIM